MAIPVSLGMPAAPPPVLAPRRQTRQLDVGGVGVGSDFPVSVQSMTTTKTADINATLQQIAELTAAGCQIVRVAVPDTDDAAHVELPGRPPGSENGRGCSRHTEADGDRHGFSIPCVRVRAGDDAVTSPARASAGEPPGYAPRRSWGP